MQALLIVHTDKAAVVADEENERHVFGYVAIGDLKDGPAVLSWLRPLRSIALRALGLRPFEVLKAENDLVGVDKPSLLGWRVVDHAELPD